MSAGDADAPTVLVVPASPAQRRLWAIEQDAGGTAIHNICFQVTRPGPLKLDALREALADLAVRHETLRTSFRLTDGVLTQRVHAPGRAIPLEYVDLTGLSPDDAARELTQARRGVAAASFDLAAAPLFRMALLRRRAADAGPATLDSLVFVVHHIVADATSAHILMGDLNTAYLARAAGTPPRWEPVPVQYADYSAWLAGQADSAQTADDLAYWAEHLAGLGVLDLTYGRPRPGRPSGRGTALPVEIGTELAARISELARQEHATPFMVLLAAYAWVLGRVFGSADVPVGMSVSTRTDPGVRDTVGMFVERAVLRADLSGRPSLRDLVRRARLEVLAAHEHSQVGFDRIVEAAAPVREYGVEPLAQASINLQPALPDAIPGSDDTADGQFGNETVRHDLALDLTDGGSWYHGRLEFRDGIVEPAAARRVAALFGTVLHAGCRDPGRPLDEIPVVGGAELTRLHASQDGGPLPGTAGAGGVLDLVRGWVTRTPDALAVDAPDGRLTYRELAAAAGAVTRLLRDRGVTAEEPVLVALPRISALPVAFLGILAAGACYVPVDPAAPAARLAAIAGAVAARIALVAPGSQAALPPGVTSVPVAAGGQAGPPDAWATRPAAAAYTLFTSGSTGTPKGVVVEHRNLLGYVAGLLGLLDPPPGAVHLLVQAPTFDSSLGTITAALASGGVLRLVSEDAARDPALLADLLDGAPAGYLKITPSHLTALLSGVPLPVLRPSRALILGGEGAQHSLAGRLTDAGWTVYGHYGPTETTIGVLAGELRSQTATPSRTVPLRTPLPGVTCYVLDESGTPVPPGCRGELYLGGALVTRGYAGMPAATAAAFLPDPFSKTPGARMYRSGDLVRRINDAEFEFCGRLDRQRKLRGHRIEPGEVEAALAGVPGVSQATVLVTGDGTPRLTGYVVPEPGRVLTADGLLAELATRLPAYLMPESVVLLGELPMTRSGKLDTAALPRPRAAEDSQGGDPVTEHEILLAGVWRSVLKVARIGVDTPFFTAGGDSITAIEVVARARARGFPLSVRDLFEQQTIRRLAAAVAAGPAEPLAARAARAGLGAALAPVEVRVASAEPAAAGDAERHDGIAACRDGATVTLTADPARASDRDLARFAALLATGEDAPGPVAADLPPDAVRLALSDQVTAALGEFPVPDAATHDAYGTRPADLATAAVLDAIAGGTGADAAAPAIVLADCAAADSLGNTRHTLPGAVRLHPPGPGGWADPGELLRDARAAVRAAAGDAGGWVAAALRGQAEVPGTVLRLLPLPRGASLTRAGWAAGGAARTTVILAGQDLLVAPGGDDAARLAERVRARLESLAAHCAASRPVYHADDFPDAGLDEEALARLLGQIGGA